MCKHTNTFTHVTHGLSLISLLAAVIITDASDAQEKREQVKKQILGGRESTRKKKVRGEKEVGFRRLCECQMNL